MGEANRVLGGAALLAFALLFSARPTPSQGCVANPSCDQDYGMSGSSGSCSWDYAQLYCNGEYCDVDVETCESGSGFSESVSCSCY
ncbi:MAG: hypothetical protein ACRD06_01035 [Terriglobia bacterium]